MDEPVVDLGPVPKGRRLEELPALLEALPRLGATEAEAFKRDLEAARELFWDTKGGSSKPRASG